MKPVAYRELHAAPWKNGGGVTRELACFPPGAGFEDFVWRVSIAEVNSSGPFSVFPGIDRIIALLDGDGMLLQFADGAVHALNRRWSPFAFGGEAQLQAELCGSPSRDFNLMLRRGRARGNVVAQRASCTIAGDASSVLLFCAAGSWRIADNVVLHEGDHVVFSPSGDTAVDMLAAGCLFCVSITLLHNDE